MRRLSGTIRSGIAWHCDTVVLCEMGIEENDESVTPEVLAEVKAIEAEEEKQRIEVLLSGDYDRNNAILSFIPEQAEQRPRTGRRCFTACTPAGAKSTATTSN